MATRASYESVWNAADSNTLNYGVYCTHSFTPCLVSHRPRDELVCGQVHQQRTKRGELLRALIRLQPAGWSAYNTQHGDDTGERSTRHTRNHVNRWRRPISSSNKRKGTQSNIALTCEEGPTPHCQTGTSRGTRSLTRGQGATWLDRFCERERVRDQSNGAVNAQIRTRRRI